MIKEKKERKKNYFFFLPLHSSFIFCFVFPTLIISDMAWRAAYFNCKLYITTCFHFKRGLATILRIKVINGGFSNINTFLRATDSKLQMSFSLFHCNSLGLYCLSFLCDFHSLNKSKEFYFLLSGEKHLTQLV